MTQVFAMPSVNQVKALINRCFPSLGSKNLSFLAAGWDFWAYASDEYVFRVPKTEIAIQTQARERLFTPVIAPLLPASIPAIEFACESGPNGHPLAGYRRVRGTPVGELPNLQAPWLGRPLGEFLRALHSMPLETVKAAGVRFPPPGAYAGSPNRERITALFESVAERVFPLISRKAQQMATRSLEAFLNDDASFQYTPCLVHADLGRSHVLVDPEAQCLAGVIDFGDLDFGDPAMDFASVFAGGLGKVLGAEGVESCIQAYGPLAESLASRARFYQSLFAYYDVLWGLDIGDRSKQELGIRDLEERSLETRPCP